ncbi:extracellular solute-binding protein [Myxococcota bacterium]|nr:extracellular solute-binding protein [Myxococcota bacterium]
MPRWVALFPVLTAAVACRIEIGAPEHAKGASAEGAAPAGKVTIYTSMYRHVIDAVTPILKAEVPGVDVEWLQSGSEKIATRLDAELAAGAPRADLVMTSDPLYYERLKREGHLLPYASIRALAMPRELVDPDGAYVTARLSVMVLGYDGRKIPAADAPASFAALFSERWRGQVTIPDPLASGTAFTTLVFLTDVLGPDVVDQMKAAGTVASGGNSAALTRIESGEHVAGFLLLENVLAAKRNTSPVAFTVPSEGAVLIPGSIAILKRSTNPAAAKAIYDVILSDAVQREIIRGDMHSPFEALPPPDGAPTLEVLEQGRMKWSRGFTDRAMAGAEALRKRWAEVMGGG